MFSLLLSLLLPVTLACPSKVILAVGSYTFQEWVPGSAGEGVTLFTLSATLNKSTTIHPILSGTNPSYLAHKSSMIYAVNENAPATLTVIKSSPTFPFVTSQSLPTNGNGATHVAVRQDHVLVANFGGSVSSFSINPFKLVDEFKPRAKLAAVNRNPKLDSFPFNEVHPHMVLPYDRGVIVPDLGASIVFYLAVSPKGTLSEIDRVVLKPDDGPRHAALHPSGTILVVTEVSLSLIELRPGCGQKPGRLGVCGRRKLLANDFGKLEGASAAAIRVTKDGQFVYASIRRGDDEGLIVGFRLGQKGEVQRRIGVWSSGGVRPRDFFVVEGVKRGGSCPSYLAAVNRDSNNLVLFERDRGSGKVLESKGTLMANVTTPTSVSVIG